MGRNGLVTLWRSGRPAPGSTVPRAKAMTLRLPWQQCPSGRPPRSSHFMHADTLRPPQPLSVNGHMPIHCVRGPWTSSRESKVVHRKNTLGATRGRETKGTMCFSQPWRPPPAQRHTFPCRSPGSADGPPQRQRQSASLCDARWMITLWHPNVMFIRHTTGAVQRSNPHCIALEISTACTVQIVQSAFWGCCGQAPSGLTSMAWHNHMWPATHITSHSTLQLISVPRECTWMDPGKLN